MKTCPDCGNNFNPEAEFYLSQNGIDEICAGCHQTEQEEAAEVEDSQPMMQEQLDSVMRSVEILSQRVAALESIQQDTLGIERSTADILAAASQTKGGAM